MFAKRTSRHSEGSIGKPHPKMQFTPSEDAQLVKLVKTYGESNWETIANIMGNRNIRQCKERYMKYLSPDINRCPFTEEEDNILIEKYNAFGPRWVKISKFFNNRTDAALKNRWNVLVRHHNNSSAGSSSSSSSTQTSASSPISEPDSDYEYTGRSQPSRSSKRRRSQTKKVQNTKTVPEKQIDTENTKEADIFSIFNNFEEEELLNFNFDLDLFSEESFKSF